MMALFRIERSCRTPGGRLRAERRRLRLTQPHAGAVAGISRSTVSNWEFDAGRPTERAMARWAEAGMDTHFIRTGNRRPEPAPETAPKPAQTSQIYRDYTCTRLPSWRQDPVVRLWDALRFARQPVTLDHLDHACAPIDCAPGRTSMSVVRLWVDAWVAGGFLISSTTEAQESFVMPNALRKTRTPPPVKMRAGRAAGPECARYRIWYTLRHHKRMDLAALCMAAEVERGQALRYLSLLVRAGYAERLTDALGHPAYAMKRDPGPAHPKLYIAFGEVREGPLPTSLPAKTRNNPAASAAHFFERER